MAPKKPERLTLFHYIVGSCILVLFVAYCVRQLAGGGEIPIPIHGLMAIITGSLFVFVQKNGNGNGKK